MFLIFVVFYDLCLDVVYGVCLVVIVSDYGWCGWVLFVYGFGQICYVWNVIVCVLNVVGLQMLVYDVRGYGDLDWNGVDLFYYGEQFVDDLIVLVGEQLCLLVLVVVLMGGLFGLLVELCWLGLFLVMVLVDIILCWDIVGVECIFVFMIVYFDGFVLLFQVVDVILVYMLYCLCKFEQLLCVLFCEDGYGCWCWYWDLCLVVELVCDSEQYQDVLVEVVCQVKCLLLLVSGGCSDLVMLQIVVEFLVLVLYVCYVQLL